MFLIYGVKSRSGHDRSQSFGRTWHVSGPEKVMMKIIDDSASFLLEKLKNQVSLTKSLNV